MRTMQLKEFGGCFREGEATDVTSWSRPSRRGVDELVVHQPGADELVRQPGLAFFPPWYDGDEGFRPDPLRNGRSIEEYAESEGLWADSPVHLRLPPPNGSEKGKEEEFTTESRNGLVVIKLRGREIACQPAAAERLISWLRRAGWQGDDRVEASLPAAVQAPVQKSTPKAELRSKATMPQTHVSGMEAAAVRIAQVIREGRKAMIRLSSPEEAKAIYDRVAAAGVEVSYSLDKGDRNLYWYQRKMLVPDAAAARKAVGRLAMNGHDPEMASRLVSALGGFDRAHETKFLLDLVLQGEGRSNQRLLTAICEAVEQGRLAFLPPVFRELRERANRRGGWARTIVQAAGRRARAKRTQSALA